MLTTTVIVQAVLTERKALFSVAVWCAVCVYQQQPLLRRCDTILVPAAQEQADSYLYVTHETSAFCGLFNDGVRLHYIPGVATKASFWSHTLRGNSDKRRTSVKYDIFHLI